VRIAVLTLLFFATAAQALEPVDSVVGSSGQLDAVRVADFVAWAGPLMKQYPPHFKSEADQKQVVDVTRRVVSELDSADIPSLKDQHLLADAAFIYAMAYNVNLDTGPQAKRTFEQAIALKPDDRRSNYLFGMFLASTKRFHFESLAYLEKANALGEKDAQFTIGLLLVEKGEKDKGLAILEAYAKEHPESEHTRKTIEAIKNGSLTFQQSDG